ncbi:MAG: hypothetical protein A3G05_02150 [Candidatus Zambryskibacteria bacterium RIFCSPLOWO2_12_FULL_45_14]|uniref:ABC transporter ATP-binding protein n=2 Tax=Candidatus Zambryskiibacteriota TaxID=1817925 RepID=A0A1G2UNG3_9BACT|nr:MAG: hypothetical protein A3H60_02140 [Candidatus Zambryskibacteria bacterium RIFCSPLOWO2_02_FULL_44_12b]OHB13708.1 MAG: hypothetical protein A3G05_02150 [Candidatus Zambryskibacteria bacterium RIFCSPLOWO2_12_FULL_45_14]
MRKYFLYWQNAGNLLWEAYGSYKSHFVVLVILGIVANGLEALSINILIPLFSFFGEDQSATTDPISSFIVHLFGYLNLPFTLIGVLVLICLLFVIKAGVMFVFGYLKNKVKNEYERNLKDHLLSRILSAKWPYLLKQKQGYLETIFTVDVIRASSAIETIFSIIITVTGLLIYLLVAINISQAVTAMTIVFAIIGFIIFKPLVSQARRVSQKSVNLQKDAIHHVSESATGIKLIKILGVEEAVSAIGKLFSKEYERLQNKGAVIQHLAAVFIKPLSVIFISFILVFSYYYTAYNIGALIAIVYLVQQMFGHVQNLQVFIHTLNERVPYIRAVLDYQKEIIKAQEEYNEQNGKPFIFSKNISFNNVVFSYTSHKKILDGVSLTVPRGVAVGFVGESGVGKTTIFDLVTRLFEPDSGEILVDGTDIKDIRLSDLRNAIGYVSQDMFLLSTSVADNIRFYDSSITNRQIIDAAKKAHIFEFIDSLPEKFNTLVGERGVTLSVGQRQRVIIARALARNPQILLLDEATSALDNESELYVKEAIEGLKGKTTVLIIAHRLSTLSNVDKIFVLKDGKIVEHGKSILADHN